MEGPGCSCVLRDLHKTFYEEHYLNSTLSTINFIALFIVYIEVQSYLCILLRYSIAWSIKYSTGELWVDDKPAGDLVLCFSSSRR